ncbi:MAG: hypothetical protein DSY91_02610 [Deltaproteobacteria bacterium]|nr:MAG: hypothetical protein DSY91_02610 [Deltaproteobacteria bacterium]
MKTIEPSPITPDMTLLDIVEKHPSAKEVFEKYDGQAGECILCYSLFDTLEDVIKKYRLDGERLLSELNAL